MFATNCRFFLSALLGGSLLLPSSLVLAQAAAPAVQVVPAVQASPVAPIIAATQAAASADQAATQPVTPAFLVERNVAMRTRDGITLKADVYRPNAPGRFPVLLARTPYDKTGHRGFGERAAQRGYIVVVQDVRGRYSSDGDWYPFKNEMRDGFDAVEWAAKLPQSDGRVGMYSGSYVGATQMLAAIGQPPHLAGICPIVTSSNYHESWIYQGGAFEQWFNESWTTGLAQNTAQRFLTETIQLHSNAMNNVNKLPLADYPVFDLKQMEGGAHLTGLFAPYFADWVAHPDYDAYWKQWSIEENFQNIRVPALVMGAWYDIFLGGSLRNYEGIRDHGATPEARMMSQLLVYLGGHSGTGRTVGEVDFGPDAAFEENNVILEWYDYLFKHVQNRFAGGKPVKLFVMGENKWRDEEAWPLARAKNTHYYLHSSGKANSAAGDGLLSSLAPRQEAFDSFVYDPANPVPTVGGPLCCDPARLPSGPRKQNELEARPDVLVYSTAPLLADQEVTGPVTLDLWATSSAVDTDFTAKLVDVDEDGKAINVTEGILRARYRDSRSAPTLLAPGEPTHMVVDLWATSRVFAKGHRIRLEVASSNFPRFDRNLNTGNPAGSSAAMLKATNAVLHDAAHPTALMLPLVPR